MSNAYDLYYSLKDKPSQIFILRVIKGTTCSELLQIISEIHKKKFSYLIYQESEISPYCDIYDFWELDPQYVFVASVENNINEEPNNFSIPDSFIDQSINDNSRPRTERILEKFQFFYTSYDTDMLFNGTEIELDLKEDANYCRDVLFSIVKKKNDSIVKNCLIMYVAGGLPFFTGTLEDVYKQEDYGAKKVIYGVVHKQINAIFLYCHYSEICNARGKHRKSLFSSVCDSTDRGISDMACLLGYLSHDGLNNEVLYRAFASIIHFAPFITSLRMILDNENVTGDFIVTVTATLFTYFRSLLPPTIPDDHVLEYTLPICNLIANINDLPEKVPIFRYEFQTKNLNKDEKLVRIKKADANTKSHIMFNKKKNSQNYKFGQIVIPNSHFRLNSEKISQNYKYDRNIIPKSLIRFNKNERLGESKCFTSLDFKKMNLESPVYIFKGDLGDDFPLKEFSISFDDIENSFERFSTIAPIGPLSIYNQFGCAIIKGKDHEYLYLMNSPLKGEGVLDNADILDPINGLTESYNIEAFAKSQNNPETGEVTDIIDPDKVKQIIMYDLDESGSMRSNLEGHMISKTSSDVNRICYACQYIQCFINKLHGYKSQCIQGLISFNKESQIRSPLTPFNEIEKALEKIKPNSISRLWDSLALCCNEIVKFRKDIYGNEIYKNAVSRIILVVDGNDTSSKINIEDVVKELIKNRIIVDCIVINKDKGENFEQVSAICHLTGGLIFHPKDYEAAISIFEESKFVNYEERLKPTDPLIPGDKSTIPFHIKPEQITRRFLNKLFENATYDDDVKSKELLHETINEPLITPRHFIGKNIISFSQSSRIRRIIQELSISAEINDEHSPNYDPDMKIFIHKSNIDEWRVFIRSQEDSIYGNKWWWLHISFPNLYPTIPPNIRFVTVPYHINISPDGRICMDIIEDRYMSSKHVVEIVQEIKELFIYANPVFAVSVDTYSNYVFDNEDYERYAKKLAEDNAKSDYNEYLLNKPADDVPEGFRLDHNYDPTQACLISQLSGKSIETKNAFLASSGIYYDKKEIMQYLSTRKKPICMITGKELRERVSKLSDRFTKMDKNDGNIMYPDYGADYIEEPVHDFYYMNDDQTDDCFFDDSIFDESIFDFE